MAQFSDTALGFQTGTRDVGFCLRLLPIHFGQSPSILPPSFMRPDSQWLSTKSVWPKQSHLLVVCSFAVSHAPRSWLYELFWEQTHTAPVKGGTSSRVLKNFNIWIVIRINHWAIHLMLFKGLIKYVSNFHFRILIKVFIENCAASSGFKTFLRGGVGLESNLTPKWKKVHW